MKSLFALLCLLSASFSHAQFTSRIIDSRTGQPVEYVNIWMETEKRGTTSDAQGYFSFTDADSSQRILISAMGYKLRKIRLGELKDTLLLKPISTVLPEVSVIPMQGERMRVINEFRKRDGRGLITGLECSWHTCKDPKLMARYFSFDKEYKATPFLKRVSVLTDSDVDQARFRIRLYAVNDTGGPGEYLVYEAIEAIADDGVEKTSIDLEHLKVRVPEEGFFIAIEHLALPQNQYLLDGADGEQDQCYAPIIGSVKQDQEGLTFVYYKGKWYKRFSEYCLPAMELVLSD